MSIEISFRGQSIEAVSLQVKEILKGTTLTRKKVIECCQTIFDSQEREASAVKFYLKKMNRRLFDKNRKDAAFGAFAEKIWESVKIVPGDSIDRLPVEVLKQVLNYDPVQLSMLQAGLQFNKAINEIRLQTPQVALSKAFGAAEWMEFMGAEIGEEPPLPANILEILAEACPFSGNGRMVAETHLLMLIPETINGEPLNLNSLGMLFKAKFSDIGDETGYRFIWQLIQTNVKNHGKSRWVLMTRDVIEGSRGETFNKQQALVATRGQNKYEVPLALVAAACILLEYARSMGRTRLYGDEPLTFTLCQENLNGFSLVVGGFTKAGLFFYIESETPDYIGVGAIREL
jgi:hypothetical protein